MAFVASNANDTKGWVARGAIRGVISRYAIEKSENIGAKIRKLNEEGGANGVRIRYQLMTISRGIARQLPMFDVLWRYMIPLERLMIRRRVGVFAVRNFAAA